MGRNMDMPRQKLAESPYCRVCGSSNPQAHHIVHRRLGGDEWRDNIIPLCAGCHQDVHDRKIDLLAYLDHKEQGYAAWLIGIERAHRLLAPSVYRKPVAA